MKVESRVQVVDQCAPWKMATDTDTFHHYRHGSYIRPSNTTAFTITIQAHRFDAVSMVIVKMAYLTLLPFLS
jgi:hypothetical protein